LCTLPLFLRTPCAPFFMAPRWKNRSWFFVSFFSCPFLRNPERNSQNSNVVVTPLIYPLAFFVSTFRFSFHNPRPSCFLSFGLRLFLGGFVFRLTIDPLFVDSFASPQSTSLIPQFFFFFSIFSLFLLLCCWYIGPGEKHSGVFQLFGVLLSCPVFPLT